MAYAPLDETEEERRRREIAARFGQPISEAPQIGAPQGAPIWTPQGRAFPGPPQGTQQMHEQIQPRMTPVGQGSRFYQEPATMQQQQPAPGQQQAMTGTPSGAPLAQQELDTSGGGTPPTTYSDVGSMLEGKIGETRTKKYERQGLWKRLGTGLLAGVHDWVQAGQPGGAWGILGALGAGAAAHGISPTVDIENRRRFDLERLFNRYGQYNAVQEAKGKRQIQQMDLQAKGEGIYFNRLSQAHKDPLLNKGELNNDQIDYIKRTYKVKEYMNPDNPQFEQIEVEGRQYIRRKNDPTWHLNTSLPGQRNKYVQPFTLKDASGKSMSAFLTGPEAMRLGVDLKVGEAKSEFEQAKWAWEKKQDVDKQTWEQHKFKIEQQNKQIDQDFKKQEMNLKQVERLAKDDTERGAVLGSHQKMQGIKGQMDYWLNEMNKATKDKDATDARDKYMEEYGKWRSAFGEFLQNVGKIPGGLELWRKILGEEQGGGGSTPQSTPSDPFNLGDIPI